MRIKYVICLSLCWVNICLGDCVGRFVSPISDICWSCLFPMTLGPVAISEGREDTTNPSFPLCFCKRLPNPVPMPGIPVGFWEPVRLVDVTRTPYCLVNIGGLKLGNSVEGRGSLLHGPHGKHTSFYQVHWYIYPLIYWLELLTDFMCLEEATFDVAYLTEFDVTWNNEEWGFLTNPEASLFANPIAQASCALDCTQATMGFPMDSLTWCAGCQGSLYPLTGFVTNHQSGVDSALLLTERMIASLHRKGLAEETSGERALCKKRLLPTLKKSQYKTQMTYPKPNTGGKHACTPLGRMSSLWASQKEYPVEGEDFGFLIWRKRNCCVL